MPTLAQAIKEYVTTIGSATSEDIKREISKKYPNKWKITAIQAHLYACAVNQPKAYIHHRSYEKFLYKSVDGTFQIYDEVTHGPNKWAPQDENNNDNEVTEVAELAENIISLERDMEDHLVQNISAIEEGMKVIQRQLVTDIGRIDIMAEDKQGVAVIIEVKVGEAKDSSVGQIARYLGWYSATAEKPVRAILIAHDFPLGVVYAAAAIPNLKLMSYRVQFTFQEAVI
jgi:hypothetical protein